MDSVRFESASNFSLEQVTLAFNVGFTGYYLPMTQTPAGLAGMMQENDVRLSASLVLLVDGALAGIGLVALRGERGWIGGMGVGPQWRGHGLGRQLLTRLLDKMREEGAHTAQLEALTVNSPALSLYADMGFRDTRELRVHQGLLRVNASLGELASTGERDSVRLGPVEPQQALREFSRFHQVAPAWQREAQGLLRMPRLLTGLGLWEDERLLAYALYARQPGGFVTFDAGSCHSSPEMRRAHIAALLLQMASGQEDAVARAINTPPGDALGDALDWLGCPVVARQREMARPLD